MLLANRYNINLADGNPFVSVPLNAGIGAFVNAHGTVDSVPAGNGSSNITITYAT